MSNKYIFSLLTLNIYVCSCWVLTDINNKALIDNSIGDLDRELTPEEIAEAQLRLRISLIFPGTKWCGPGDVADSYDDLGTAEQADMCCRDHDHCEGVIPSGETKHNLTNTAYYSRLSCECDERFRQCLRKDNSTTSKAVGVTYFNIIGTKCFRNDFPIVACKKKGGWLNTKCVEYSYDTSGEKLYQWFDVPKY